MAAEQARRRAPRLGVGQVMVEPDATVLAPSTQIRHLYQLSDPALSELGLEDLLAELLDRVQVALDVDTIAILLHDAANHQLVARAATGIEEEVEQGVRIPIGQGFAGRIAAERVAILIADVDHADILNPILREKGIRSLLGVPLIVEGDLIGVMHVGSLHPRTFDAKDVAVLQLAAARAAPAIERARLLSELEREHGVAVLLQRSLLPRALPEVTGASVAVRYLPARDEVGGDWYDVIELPRGRVGLAIGDVVGHGISAAALMGQLRTALRSYAIEGYGPGTTLELVDRFVQAMGEYAMATAAYAVFDPETGSMRLATAGHPPPVIVSEGSSRLIEMTPCAPLGGFPYGTCPEHELTLEPGEILILYSDGLVERRGVPLTETIDELVDALRASTSRVGHCDRDAQAAAIEMRLGDLKFQIRDEALIARLSGEVDMSNAGELLAAVTDATPKDVLGVVLDFSAVDYIDSGIHLMYRLRESLRTRGKALRILIPSDSPVNDTLRLAGVDRSLEVVKTVDEGVQALAGAS